MTATSEPTPDPRPAPAAGSTPAATPVPPTPSTPPATPAPAPATPVATPTPAPAPVEPVTSPTVPVGRPATAAATPTPAPAKATPAPAPKPVVNAALKKPRRTPAESGGHSGAGAVLVALCALLIAAGAVVVAIYSLNVAREAKSAAATAASAAERATAGSRATPSAAAPAPTTPAPSPTPTYVADLRSAQVTVPPTVGCVSLFVDVDSGTTGNFNGHDFYFSSCLGPTTVHLDEVAAGAATTAGITPEACVAQLTGVSPTPEVTLTVTQGLSFCLLTSKDAASRQGLPQRVAVIDVQQIAADRTVSLSLSTYHLAT